MPKEHFPLMPLMPEDLIGHLFMAAKALSRVMLTAVNSEGVDIFVANGTAAGQRAQHFMLHIIPRRPEDKVNIEIPVNELPEKEVESAVKEIEGRVAAIFKQPKKEAKEEKKPKEAPKPDAPAAKKHAGKKSEKEEAPKKKKETGISLDDIAELLK